MMNDQSRDDYRKATVEQIHNDFKALYGRKPLQSHGDKEAVAILWAARLVCDAVAELQSDAECSVEMVNDTLTKILSGE
jgi:hypothetical protein